ncbi:MAG: DNA repair protein RecN, partial [Verrucomicrobia bacterium]|nr:DNA repair protein RecN [Verrucomicrobiota bacterium]
LQWLDDRLSQGHRLKQKYGNDLNHIRAHLQEAKARLTELETRDDRLKDLTAQEIRGLGETMELGAKLSQARTSAASSLAKEIRRHLKDLGFKHGNFSIRISPLDVPQPAGCDEIEFEFAPNVGEDSRPLRLIASSGEISRVMLAIKAVLARHDRIPVLFFDEIDANIGGEIGNAVGQKMRAVAASHQVICITHLPQVAVFGQHHLVVSKTVKGNRTLTEIHAVSAEDRKEEIARMLGGRDLTQVTLQHAHEMLERHQ